MAHKATPNESPAVFAAYDIARRGAVGHVVRLRLKGGRDYFYGSATHPAVDVNIPDNLPPSRARDEIVSVDVLAVIRTY